jgi:hypothetical protein
VTAIIGCWIDLIGVKLDTSVLVSAGDLWCWLYLIDLG